MIHSKEPHRYEDPIYPPINREETCLGIIEMHVLHADGVAMYDPNQIIVASVMVDPASIKDPHYHGVVPLRGLKPSDDAKSFLSGEPAVVYLEDDARIPLTVEELIAYVGHSLHPAEYFRIRGHYGMLHQIHGDFYDVNTGEARAPRDEARLEGPAPTVMARAT